MPPRASWKGHLRMSLVSVPVQMFTATNAASSISLNQLHKGCHQRIKMQTVCPEHGRLERTEIVKGYEYEDGRYVVIDEADLAKLAAAKSKVIEVNKFVDAAVVDPIYFDSPYYLAPDGPVAEEAFRVIRQALADAGKAALASMVIGSREQSVLISPQSKGMRLVTLRAADEVRAEQPYFEEIKDEPAGKDKVKMAEMLIDNLEGSFDPAEQRDRYREGLQALIKSKMEGKETVVVQEVEVAQTINFMEALQKSLASVSAKKPAAKSVKPAAGAAASGGAAETKKRKRA
jgi:DNA end-binding protein Ku